MGSIHFFVEDIHFKLPNPKKTSRWIKKAIACENRGLGEINVIFCSDNYLHRINRQYLNHNTLTDIVTFDYSVNGKSIEGDVFISIDRVKENAIEFESGFSNELNRVIIHGVLHLIGYSDKSTRQKSEMRRKEDTYLSLYEREVGST